MNNINGFNQSRSVGNNHQNQQHGEANGRQNWRIFNRGTTLYMNHLHTPGTRNEQTFRCEVATSNSLSISCEEGFATITELSGLGHNLT